MIEKLGDLFTSDAPALAHGVNCHGVMGAGIALQFAKRYPEMEEAYKRLCAGVRVAGLTTVLRPGGFYAYFGPVENVDGGAMRRIYNVASQNAPGPDARLDWLVDSLTGAAEDAKRYGIDRIAIPRIGCGIGGLDWNEVRPALEEIEQETGIEFEVWVY